jgi:hypothetical protein
MFRLAAFLGAIAITSPAVSEDSVILGHGVSNAFLALPPCPQPAYPNFANICLDANYVWVINAVHTVAGPMISGSVRAFSVQHTRATAQFVKSVELFVLRPIADPAIRRSAKARYYLVTFSSRDAQGRYCLPLSPTEVGLKLTPAEVKVDAVSGDFCFSASALASNSRWSGP